MNSLIFRTTAPLIVIVMLVFAVFVLLRGHNQPGGGFIAGLIVAAAMAVYGMAFGVEAVGRALRLPPLAIAGLGIFLAICAGLPSLLAGAPFLTGLWAFFRIGGTDLALSTPLLFDVGVCLGVFGTLCSIIRVLEAESEGADG
jgi:multicomponent Na+:H+ antiporter subunit B